ncbi:MAG TPA: GNAT family N-acetyltransferase, partial [Acidimicrobiales bacterium]|nr:GNAT family N-acetyltransferase [Acidimicrobiales bacterium]
MVPSKWQTTTARTVVTPARQGDAAAIAAIANDPIVAAAMGAENRSAEAFESQIALQLSGAATNLLVSIRAIDADVVVGYGQVTQIHPSATPEVEIAFAKEGRGIGFGREALPALISWLFCALASVPRGSGTDLPTNEKPID